MRLDSITARVYVFSSSDSAALKKMLEYDPYLDPNIIPKTPKEWDDEKYLKAHPEEAQDIAAKKKQASEAMTKLRDDKEANIIFARQDYQLKDGISLGLEREKAYLYLSAQDSFLNDAEAKLKKNFKTMERAKPEIEKQIIDTLDEQQQKSEEGLGFIFGG